MTGDNEEEMVHLKQFLDQEFRIKDLGSLHYFLGIKAIPQGHDLILTQRKFTIDLLAEFECNNLSVVSSPLVYGHKLTASMGTPLSDPTLYRRLMRKLNYLTNTRPDLPFSI